MMNSGSEELRVMNAKIHFKLEGLLQLLVVN
jgi:hypothetical protein